MLAYGLVGQREVGTWRHFLADQERTEVPGHAVGFALGLSQDRLLGGEIVAEADDDGSRDDEGEGGDDLLEMWECPCQLEYLCRDDLPRAVNVSD